MWKVIRIEFFFKHLSGRDSKTVNFPPTFWDRFVLINVIIRGLGKKNLEFAIWLQLARGAVGVLFFDPLEKHILFSDNFYWLQMLGRHLETNA